MTPTCATTTPRSSPGLIEQSHPAGLMTAYNAINGTPVAANTYTVNTLARDTYGFRGYVTSDCGGIKTTYANPPAGHDWAPPGFTTDSGDATAIWTNTATGAKISGGWPGGAGVLRCGAGTVRFELLRQENKLQYIQAAINAGVLSVGVIDQALVNCSPMRIADGRVRPGRAGRLHQDHQGADPEPGAPGAGRAVAEQSLVLLKNDTLAGNRPAAAAGRPDAS